MNTFRISATANQRLLATATIVALYLQLSPCAGAQTPKFDELIVFGDSGSDTGNVLLLTGGLAPLAPYYGGRFSNGPVWVERLAERLHFGHSDIDDPLPAPNFAGGTHYAVGGAETGPGYSATVCVGIGQDRVCAPNIGRQIESYFEAGGTLDGDELIVVQGGSNNQSAEFAAVQMADHVATLAAAGGEFFLVPNLDRISQYPGFVHDDLRWETFVTQFNATLSEELDVLDASIDATIIRADWLELSDDIIENPAKYHLSNITDPACPGCGALQSSPDVFETLAANPEEYLFWDGAHLTTAAHEIYGDAAVDSVLESLSRRPSSPTSVPEPATFQYVVLSGLVLLFRWIRTVPKRRWVPFPPPTQRPTRH